MKTMCKFAAAALLLSAALSAQTVNLPRRVRASGTSAVSSKPDQVKIVVGVTTQAQTATDAAGQNATVTTAVLNALKQLLGAQADIQTVNYSVNPNYRYPGDGSPGILVGFTANNTVQVTSADLNNAGRIADTAVQAGATSIQAFQFSIKDPEPLRAQALRQASQVARSHAEAIAAGVGARLGAIANAAEGSVSVPVGVTTAVLGAAPTTPVQPGSVDVSATVTVEYDLQ